MDIFADYIVDLYICADDDEVEVVATAPPPSKKKSVLKETKNVSPDLIETTPSKFFQSKKISKPLVKKKKITETAEKIKVIISFY